MPGYRKGSLISYAIPRSKEDILSYLVAGPIGRLGAKVVSTGVKVGKPAIRKSISKITKATRPTKTKVKTATQAARQRTRHQLRGVAREAIRESASTARIAPKRVDEMYTKGLHRNPVANIADLVKRRKQVAQARQDVERATRRANIEKDAEFTRKMMNRGTSPEQARKIMRLRERVRKQKERARIAGERRHSRGVAGKKAEREYVEALKTGYAEGIQEELSRN